MADKIIRIRGSAAITKQYRIRGSCVIVRSGGWATHRLHWSAPNSEPSKEESSEPLVNGRALVPPSGRFDEFWISCETMQRAPEDIVLLVLDETKPVVLLNEKRATLETQLLASSDTAPVTPGATSTSLLYTDQVWAGSTSLLDVERRHYWPQRFLAGGAVGDQPFTIKLFAKLTSQSSTPLAPYAEWTCDLLDAVSNTYGCNFQFGARPLYRAGAANTHVGVADLPFPIYGLALYVIVPGAVAMTTFTYAIHAAARP